MSKHEGHEEDQNILSHEYDGIRELDNPLPLWWLASFFITIFFSFIYYIHYEFAAGPSMDEELATALSKIERLQAEHGGAELNEDELLAFVNDEAAIASGKTIYDGKCAVCHGQDLQGLIGPNLTDFFWVHGEGRIKDIFDVVKNGAIDKGMPPWEGMLSKDEMAQVSSFVLSKVGSNPAQAKGPEGREIKPQ